MGRLLSSIVTVLLLAGAINADITRNAGEDQLFRSYGVEYASCHLTRPDGQTLDFIVGQDSTLDRYHFQATTVGSMINCDITVTNLQVSDSGVWVIYGTMENGFKGEETPYQLTVIAADEEDDNSLEVDNNGDNEVEGDVGSEVDSQETEGPEVTGSHTISEVADPTHERITWLRPIEHPTRTNQFIDISLSKLDSPEECYVVNPEGKTIKSSEVVIGLNSYGSSEFVSCRITLGPITQDLIGEWTLCGKHLYNGGIVERCQQANIYWNDMNRPNSDWSTTIQSLHNHPVHFGGVLSSVVLGMGDVVTCHVITPNGEDLVITEDTEYPNLKLVDNSCSIAIGPIQETMLGNWTLYGVFKNFVVGLNEERLPMNLYLYDKENPYNQAYNVTILDPRTHVVKLNNTINLDITGSGTIDSCEFTTPDGLTYDLESQKEFQGASFINNESTVCRLEVGPITKELLGPWTITGKFNNKITFSKREQTIEIVEEDPENPIDHDRVIEYINERHFESKIGESHKLIITSDIFINGESCHVVTPNGLQYKIMEGFQLPGVEVLEGADIECGVNITVLSKESTGKWTLIARATRHSQLIERRLPFTINVEEIVAVAMPNEISIKQGDDLYVRLKDPTVHNDTCALHGPNNTVTSYEVDPLHAQSCGFIIRNLNINDSGIWEIVFGPTSSYRAPIVVHVTAETAMTSISVVRDRAVDLLVGPAEAIYCKLEDPLGHVVFDGFSRCHLSLEKVTLDHHGAWKMSVGYTGRVLLDEQQLYMTLLEADSKPVVTTHVEKESPLVRVSCSIATDASILGCKFRDGHGNILLANGNSEDRFSFEGGVSTSGYSCGLVINNPLVSDLGLWRCAIDTSEGTYYGFLDVLCPWALADPVVAATVQQVPVLAAERALVSAVSEEPVTVSCNVQSAIRYCYFRAPNGTTFTVNPTSPSSNMEYVGAGFEAGECGLRFLSMGHTDSGRWSCHVGLVGDLEEQRDQFQLTVHERMSASQHTIHGGTTVVEGLVHEGRALEYCRFVRIDGFGFTSENVPSQYQFTGLLANGECTLRMPDATILDMHPWTIVAKIQGHDAEISRDTLSSFNLSPPEEEVHPEVPGIEIINVGRNGVNVFLMIVLSAAITALIVGAIFTSKKNRQWASQRALSLRNSFRGNKPDQPPQYPSNEQQYA